MKIIDLLNKIADGEEIPKKIMWKDELFDNDVAYFLYEYIGDCSNKDIKLKLNCNVDIIEEEPKPLTKQDVEALGYAIGEIKKCFTNGWNKSLENKSLEEDKKIEKLNNIPINYADGRTPEEVYEYLRCTINNLANVINVSNENLFELIDKVNSLEKSQ